MSKFIWIPKPTPSPPSFPTAAGRTTNPENNSSTRNPPFSAISGSVQGVKQYYHDQLRFPILYESVPLSPAHFAFEVPVSEFENVVKRLQNEGVPLLKWSDGRILYLREIGFPADRVTDFRELLVRLFNFKLDKVFDNFSFAIGGTAHAVIPSKQRKWIPISMTALPPTMNVGYGVTDSNFIEEVKARLDQQNIVYETDDELHFKIDEYKFSLAVTKFPKEVPGLLNLPFSI